jgi:hypothetical protein
MKFYFSLFISALIYLFTGCSNQGNNGSGVWEDQHDHFDTTYNMMQNQSPIKELDQIPAKKFTLKQTSSDSLFNCTGEFWKKNIAILDYVQDSVVSKFKYINSEGERYFIISKTMLNKINLVLLGQSNAKEIHNTDLLITDSLNRPLFFCAYEYIGFNYLWKPEKIELTDSTFHTLFIEDNEKGHTSFSEVDIKLDYKKAKVIFHRKLHQWFLMD